MFTFFFFNDTATTEIYTLSLHDALPICMDRRVRSILELLDAEWVRQVCVTELAQRVGLGRSRLEHLFKVHAKTTIRDFVREHRSEEHTSELQSQSNLVCRLLLEKKKRHG